jgi:hypothetical protein
MSIIYCALAEMTMKHVSSTDDGGEDGRGGARRSRFSSLKILIEINCSVGPEALRYNW